VHLLLTCPILSSGCKALFIDLSHEGICLALLVLQLLAEVDLLLMLCRLILQCVLVEHLVLLLLCVESVLVALVRLKFLHDLGLGVVCPHSQVFHLNLVHLALVDQPLVLVITQHSFLACFEFFPGFLFNHGCVGIEVLALEFDFLEFFGKTFVFFSLLALLLVDLLVCFKKTLFTGFFLLRHESLKISLLFVSSRVIGLFALLASFLNLSRLFHEFLSLLLFLGQVGLSLEVDLLLEFALVELEALPEFSDGHFLHETKATRLSRIESLSSLNRDLL